MFRNSLFLVLFLFVHLICDAQTNRDLLFGETWYTAEGLVMTFDSSGVTFESAKRTSLIDESTVYLERKDGAIEQLPIKVVLAEYSVNADSLVLTYMPAIDAYWNRPRPTAKQRNTLGQPMITLYAAENYQKKKPVENFEAFEIDGFGFKMTLDSNGDLTLRASHQVNFADRLILGVYRGALEASQIDELKTILKDSRFFSIASSSDWNRGEKEFICHTSNGLYRCYLDDFKNSNLVDYIEKLMLSSESWERNGMKYYGLKGEFAEPKDQIYLDWKRGMPEKPRIAVAGSLHYIEKVSTLNESKYVYLIQVDTVFGAPFYIKNAHQHFKKDLVVVSNDTISLVSGYVGLLLAQKIVDTPTWQTDHTGRPFAQANYFEFLESFPTEGTSPLFLRSFWDHRPMLRYSGGWNWNYRNGASSHLEFKVAKAARQAQGQSNYIRRDRSGKILPLK